MAVEKLIRAAQEQELPDLVLKNGKIVNVFTGEIISGDVAVSDGFIVGTGSYSGKREIDVCGGYIVPGLINSHLHVESSMVTPQVYAAEELRHGTTSIITDPHEIANVGGIRALEDILRAAEASPVNYYVMLPSCVPATPFEHSGAVLGAEELASLKNRNNVLGLGEMMNSVGVIGCDNYVLDKLKAFDDMIIDGHAPMLSGKSLNAYACAGIDTDHESISYEEAAEKLRCGIAVLVREGSASKNLESIISGVVEHGTDTFNMAFCTDDKHLADVMREGTIRCNLKKSVALGLPAIKAIQMATINAARIYGLKRLGAIACGYRADIVVFDDLTDFGVRMVLKDGVPSDELVPQKPVQYSPQLMDSVNFAPLAADAFVIPESEEYDVIGIVKGQIVTKHLRMTSEEIKAGLENGIVRKIAVIERHNALSYCSCAYITGYGLSHGAVGTSVAHDSHNIIIVGDNDEDMFLAANELKNIHGGYTIVSGGKTVASLPLELGGLMSLKPADEFIESFERIYSAAHEMGVESGIDPFITLSFIALPVIPELRLTDCGLFDVNNFCFIERKKGEK